MQRLLENQESLDESHTRLSKKGATPKHIYVEDSPLPDISMDSPAHANKQRGFRLSETNDESALQCSVLNTNDANNVTGNKQYRTTSNAITVSDSFESNSPSDDDDDDDDEEFVTGDEDEEAMLRSRRKSEVKSLSVKKPSSKRIEAQVIDDSASEVIAASTQKTNQYRSRVGESNSGTEESPSEADKSSSSDTSGKGSQSDDVDKEDEILTRQKKRESNVKAVKPVDSDEDQDERSQHTESDSGRDPKSSEEDSPEVKPKAKTTNKKPLLEREEDQPEDDTKESQNTDSDSGRHVKSSGEDSLEFKSKAKTAKNKIISDSEEEEEKSDSEEEEAQSTHKDSKDHSRDSTGSDESERVKPPKSSKKIIMDSESESHSSLSPHRESEPEQNASADQNEEDREETNAFQEKLKKTYDSPSGDHRDSLRPLQSHTNTNTGTSHYFEPKKTNVNESIECIEIGDSPMPVKKLVQTTIAPNGGLRTPMISRMQQDNRAVPSWSPNFDKSETRDVKPNLNALNRDIKPNLKALSGGIKMMSLDDKDQDKRMAAALNDKPAFNASSFQASALRGPTTQITNRNMNYEAQLKALSVEIIKELESKPNPDEFNEDMAMPVGLKVKLLTHQRYSMTWLKWREKNYPNGGILADDMGLGKTLTILCYLKLVKDEKQQAMAKKKAEKNSKVEEKDEDEEEEEMYNDRKRIFKKKYASKSESNECKRLRTLIILPASLLHQWQGEITSKFARDSFKVHVYHEANRKKYAYNLEDNDIVFTTYEIVSREMDIFDKEGNQLNSVSVFV